MSNEEMTDDEKADVEDPTNSYHRRKEQARRSGAYKKLQERQGRAPDLTHWRKIMGEETDD
jgi:hypothetical protein